MKNFTTLEEFISYIREQILLDKIRPLIIDSSDIILMKNSLLIAHENVSESDIFIYNLAVIRTTIFCDGNQFASLHIYFEKNEQLLEKLHNDIGNHIIQADWGFNGVTNPRIYSWNYLNYQVTLRKHYRSLKDYELSAPMDVVTITTE